MNRRHYADRAVSLLELVTVLTIIGVMAAIGAPRYASSLALYRTQAAAKRVAADVALARQRARNTSVGQTIVFDAAGSAYTLSGTKGLNGQAAYAVALSAEPYAAKIVSAAFNSSASLGFDRYGQPTSGGSVVVRSGGFTKTVVVDASTGLASVQ